MKKPMRKAAASLETLDKNLAAIPAEEKPRRVRKSATSVPVVEEPVVPAEPKKRVGRHPKATVTDIADAKAKAKPKAKPAPAPSAETAAPAPSAEKPRRAANPRVEEAPQPMGMESDDEALRDWEEMFPKVQDGKSYTYTRMEDMTLDFMKKNLGKFNIFMLVAEERQDGKFSNFVLCFISKDTLTFIDQTGGENFDEILQRPHEEVFGKREFILKTRKGLYTFPFALYVREAKK